MKYKIGDIFYNKPKKSYLTVIDVVTHTNDDSDGSYYVEGYRTGRSVWLEGWHLDNFIDRDVLVLTQDYIRPVKYIKTWTLEEV